MGRKPLFGSESMALVSLRLPLGLLSWARSERINLSRILREQLAELKVAKEVVRAGAVEAPGVAVGLVECECVNVEVQPSGGVPSGS